MSSKEIRFYKIDDSSKPGIAKVEILSQNTKMLPAKIYKVKVIEIIRPSTFAKCKVGTTKIVNGSLLRTKMPN